MKISWGHGVVIALGTFILFILGMIFLFPMGQQNSELITDDYYEQELLYQDVIDAKKRAQELNEIPKLTLKAEVLHLDFPKEINNQNSKFNFYLYRSSDQNLDIQKDFVLDGVNAFQIPAKVLVKGGYILKVMWTKDHKKYQVDYDIEWK